MLAPGFLQDVERKGEAAARRRLKLVARDYPQIFAEVRGMGLLLGMKCAIPVSRGAGRPASPKGCSRSPPGDNVLRLAPPLVVTEAECGEAVEMIRRAARRAQPSAAKVAAK